MILFIKTYLQFLIDFLILNKYLLYNYEKNNIKNISFLIYFFNIFFISKDKIKEIIYFIYKNDNIIIINNNYIDYYCNDNFLFNKKLLLDFYYLDNNKKINLIIIKKKLNKISNTINIPFLLLYFYNIKINEHSYISINSKFIKLNKYHEFRF